MSGLTRHRYKEGSFLSRDVSELRKDRMQSVLKFLNEAGHSRYNKSRLMHRLNEAERGDRISGAQLHAINSWFESGYLGMISDYYDVDKSRGIKRKRDASPVQEDLGITRKEREEPLERDQNPVQENLRIVKKENEDPLEQDIGARDCSICAEELTSASFPYQISADYMHGPTCCNACLSRYLEGQINDKPWDQITCPECPVILSYDDVKTFAREHDFITYDKNSLLSYIRNDPKFIYCLGPDCKDGQIHEGGDYQPIMTCETCSFKTCFTHKMPWHSKITCDDYDTQQRERTKQEQASKACLAKKSTVCSVCGAYVSKKYGCDHIKCKCGADFCYVCGVNYEKLGGNNDGHERTCPYYSRNLSPHPQQAFRPIRRTNLGHLERRALLPYSRSLPRS